MKQNDADCLLILGNGFDKNCGLNSSFSDFFSTINSNDNIWYILFKFAFSNPNNNRQTTIVDCIKVDDVLWMDIEDFIKRILYMHHKEDKQKLQQFYRYFGCETYCEILTLAFIQRFNTEYLSNNLQFIELKNYFEKKFNQEYMSINIAEFLFVELKRFEEDFKEYIKKQLDDNADYYNKTSALLSKLIIGKQAFDILSFNYTLPDKESIESFAFGNINNVHGNINGSIIIGFDSGDLEVDNDDGKLKMSKSWQKLFSPFSESFLPSRNNIMAIKIYGHSLSPQDYSYFYSLFDYYDIYNSNVVLQFYYTEYKKTEKDNRRIKEDYVSSIYKLLNSYVSKTDNATKGNIVINKMILENRLKILRLPKLS